MTLSPLKALALSMTALVALQAAEKPMPPLLAPGPESPAEAKACTEKEKQKAESLFSKLRGSEHPKESPLWTEFITHPAAAAVARGHLSFAAEPDRGRSAAVVAVAALEGPKAADECAKLALEDKSALVRANAKEALFSLDVPTPKRVIHAMRAKRELALRALEIAQEHPDEEGVYGLFVAAEYAGYGGGGPRGYIFNGTQYAYIKDITAVVQVQAVAYDPEIGYVQTGSVLDTRVVKVEEYMTVIHEITGKRFATPREAKAWWEANKDAVIKRIEEKAAPRK